MIIKILTLVRKIIYFPFLLSSVIQFLFREYIFGFENACNYLKKLPASSLIPILSLRGAKIGENCDIQNGIVFHNCKTFKNFIVGNNCHIGKDCFFDLRDKIVLGNNVVISMRSNFITHIDMTKSELSKIYPATSLPIIVEDHVYIGSNVSVLMGCKIGNGALIAAGSLVIDNVNGNSLVAGVPAKFIRSHIISPD